MSDSEDDVKAGREECDEPEPGHRDDEFTPWDEYHEAFGDLQPMPAVSDGSAPHLPGGGLPKFIIDDTNPSHCPPFTEENFVCVADLRKFVRRDKRWGERIETIEPGDVTRAPNGTFRARRETHVSWKLVGSALLGVAGTALWLTVGGFAAVPPAALAVAGLIWILAEPRGYVEVEPVRPVCRHLVQRLDPPLPGDGLRYGYLNRHCAVRRTVTGAFLNLTNEAVRACSVREPWHNESARLIDEMNRKKADESRSRKLYSLFNLTLSKEITGANGDGTPTEEKQ